MKEKITLDNFESYLKKYDAIYEDEISDELFQKISDILKINIFKIVKILVENPSDYVNFKIYSEIIAFEKLSVVVEINDHEKFYKLLQRKEN